MAFSELQVVVPLFNASMPMTYIDTWARGLIKRAITSLLLLGACAVVLFLLLLIRRKHLFIHWVHVCCVVLLMIRASLELAYITGPLLSVGFGMFGYGVPNPVQYYAVLACATCFMLVTMMFVEVAIVHQAWAMLTIYRSQWWGKAVIITVVLLALTVIGFEWALVIISIRAQLNRFHLATDYVDQTYLGAVVPLWVTNLPIVLFSVLINVVSLLLVIKLVMAIRTRRLLGLRQFDHLHVLLIMLTQTLVIPLVLLIINYRLYMMLDKILMLVLTLLVVLLLPLATMWAQMQNEANVTQLGMLFFTDMHSATTMINDDAHGQCTFEETKMLYK